MSAPAAKALPVPVTTAAWFWGSGMFECREYGSGFQDQGLGIRSRGLGIRVEASRLRGLDFQSTKIFFQASSSRLPRSFVTADDTYTLSPKPCSL